MVDNMPGITVELRRTQLADICRFIEAELDPDTGCWLGEISFGWHHRALTEPGMEHLSIVGGTGQAAGFAVLAGLGLRDVEMRRIVILPECRGAGIGRAAVAAVVDRVFGVHGASRVWL